MKNSILMLGAILLISATTITTSNVIMTPKTPKQIISVSGTIIRNNVSSLNSILNVYVKSGYHVKTSNVVGSQGYCSYLIILEKY